MQSVFSNNFQDLESNVHFQVFQDRYKILILDLLFSQISCSFSTYQCMMWTEDK